MNWWIDSPKVGRLPSTLLLSGCGSKCTGWWYDLQINVCMLWQTWIRDYCNKSYSSRKERQKYYITIHITYLSLCIFATIYFAIDLKKCWFFFCYYLTLFRKELCVSIMFNFRFKFFPGNISVLLFLWWDG